MKALKISLWGGIFVALAVAPTGQPQTKVPQSAPRRGTLAEERSPGKGTISTNTPAQNIREPNRARLGQTIIGDYILLQGEALKAKVLGSYLQRRFSFSASGQVSTNDVDQKFFQIVDTLPDRISKTKRKLTSEIYELGFPTDLDAYCFLIERIDNVFKDLAREVLGELGERGENRQK